ncbi:MAG TPA: alpha/beta fold hydrolase [Longimicrobiales bacterium]|nr:alpha/beta fold hydrolase [Longimicrobiales bacterium]
MRRFVIALLTGTLLGTPALAQQQAQPRTYVIVHGAWGGGWAWQTIDSLLTRQGHRVFRPSLTGLGDRVHLASPDIGLDTHITDVVNLVLWERLQNVILVGHSYGGMVITGAADRLGDRISQMIYVDAMVPDSGESALDIMGPQFRSMVRTNAKDGFIIPAWNRPGTPLPTDVPQPLKTFTDTLHLSRTRFTHPSVTYILTEEPARMPDTFAPFAQRAAARGWRVERMQGDHVPYRSAPGVLIELLRPR